jgi:hypothetical protein
MKTTNTATTNTATTNPMASIPTARLHALYLTANEVALEGYAYGYEAAQTALAELRRRERADVVAQNAAHVVRLTH